MKKSNTFSKTTETQILSPGMKKHLSEEEKKRKKVIKSTTIEEDLKSSGL